MTCARNATVREQSLRAGRPARLLPCGRELPHISSAEERCLRVSSVSRSRSAQHFTLVAILTIAAASNHAERSGWLASLAARRSGSAADDEPQFGALRLKVPGHCRERGGGIRFRVARRCPSDQDACGALVLAVGALVVRALVVSLFAHLPVAGTPALAP